MNLLRVFLQVNTNSTNLSQIQNAPIISEMAICDSAVSAEDLQNLMTKPTSWLRPNRRAYDLTLCVIPESSLYNAIPVQKTVNQVLQRAPPTKSHC